MPRAGGGWVTHRLGLDHDLGEIVVKAKVRAFEDKIVSAADLAAFALEPEIIALAGGDFAMLERRTDPSHDKALLWLPGRNDYFLHPHVGRALADESYDVYVLSYRHMGACRREMLFDNPFLNSHVTSGDFSDMSEEVSAALASIRSRKTYAKVVAYGHSTGGAVLVNHLMTVGDDGVDAVVLNAPFLDWGEGGVTETVLELIPTFAVSYSLIPAETNVDPAFDPLGLSTAVLKIWTDYEFDPASRPLYSVPVTVGFVVAATDVHERLRAYVRDGTTVTDKPCLVLASEADDVLNHEEVRTMGLAVSSAHTEEVFAANAHDVFISGDAEDNDAAIATLVQWLRGLRS